ncbi:MAG: hypothetical protein ACRC33_02505, partial [Gemmataceae bacterium]
KKKGDNQRRPKEGDVEPFEAIYEQASLAMKPYLTDERARQEFRETLRLRYQHPGAHVAFIDTWRGDRLEREVVGVAASQAELITAVATLLPEVRAKVSMRFLLPIGSRAIFAPFDAPRLA